MRGISSVRSKLVVALAAPAALIVGYLFVVPTAHSVPAAHPVPATQPQTTFDVPCTDPRGCPDLALNAKMLERAKLETATFPPEHCSVQEGQVGGTGPRRLLTFPYSTPNMGPGSLIIGDPLDPENSNLFEWGACHGHYHFKKYAAYRLWKPADFTRFQQLKAQNPNMLSGDIIANPNNGLNPVVGTKRGFCVVDVDKAKEFQGQRDGKTYTTCGFGTTIHGNQGISVGWADTYGIKLEGQWIDVTNVPDGDYILDVETNPERSFEEERYGNNSASRPVKVTR
ncbi:MAG: lysyl oxidase family protein [Actinomycetota bacterium]|nr:lysyl oxidase family protein [Actinomycetota bacterium]